MTLQEIENLPEFLDSRQITKIVDHYNNQRTRDERELASETVLVLQEVFKFNLQRCIWCGEELDSHFRGRGNKSFCNRVCHKRAWEFNRKLRELQLSHPEFFNFCKQMLKEGIPADKLNECMKHYKKQGFKSPYKLI